MASRALLQRISSPTLLLRVSRGGLPLRLAPRPVDIARNLCSKAEPTKPEEAKSDGKGATTDAVDAAPLTNSRGEVRIGPPNISKAGFRQRTTHRIFLLRRRLSRRGVQTLIYPLSLRKRRRMPSWRRQT